jgi:hypothetical protein
MTVSLNTAGAGPPPTCSWEDSLGSGTNWLGRKSVWALDGSTIAGGRGVDGSGGAAAAQVGKLQANNNADASTQRTIKVGGFMIWLQWGVMG